MENIASSAETEEHESPCHINVPIPLSRDPQQVINRVRPQFRNEKTPSPYDPVIVSIGPYHHSKPELRHAEKFKQQAVKEFVLESRHSDKSYFYQQILARVHEIRACYDDDVVCSNPALAKLILRDACFFIYQIRILISPDEPSSVQFLNHFGPGGVKFIMRDLLLLENHIPLWINELLISLQLGDQCDEWETLLLKYISYITYGFIDEDSTKSLPWGKEDENKPFHFLHAVLLFHKSVQVKAPSPTLTGNSFEKLTGQNMDLLKAKYKFSTERKKRSYQLRSITDLKAKGICCRPSEAKDKSSEDVKELQEQCVLVRNIGSNDEVVRVFREVETFGMDNSEMFLELKASMDEHCCSMAKTWKAEPMFTYFSSPFTVITLLANLFLLSLTTIQTLYTMHPAK